MEQQVVGRGGGWVDAVIGENTFVLFPLRKSDFPAPFHSLLSVCQEQMTSVTCGVGQGQSPYGCHTFFQHHPAYSSHCTSFAKNLHCVVIVFFPVCFLVVYSKAMPEPCSSSVLTQSCLQSPRPQSDLKRGRH